MKAGSGLAEKVQSGAVLHSEFIMIDFPFRCILSSGDRNDGKYLA